VKAYLLFVRLKWKLTCYLWV